MSRRELQGGQGRVSPSPAIELTLHVWEVSGSRPPHPNSPWTPPFAFRQADQVALAVTEVGLSDPTAPRQARDRAFDLDSASLLRDGKAAFTHLLWFHPAHVDDSFSQWPLPKWSFQQGVRTVYRNSADT